MWLLAYADSEGPDQSGHPYSLIRAFYLLTESFHTTERMNIGIKHSFSCINIRQVPWEVLKTAAFGGGFSTPPKGPGEY